MGSANASNPASATTPHAVDYLLIGGGLASATAAEAIRARDAQGSILIVSGETYLPYHRPPLSKEYLRGEIGPNGTYGNGGVFVQLPPWYPEQRVEVWGGVTAQSLDTAAKTARLSDGRTVGYGKALIATGGRARQLAIPGVNLPGVAVLRTLDDATAIRDAIASPGKHVLVVGSGFIGLEGAANALFKDAHVTIVDPVARAWPGMLTPDLSRYLQAQYTKRGASVYYGHAPTELLAGPDGRLAQARLAPVNDPSQQQFTVPCDLAIIGVGVQLNTEVASASGLTVDPRQGVVVDDHLHASAPDVFAAGDIAAYPDPVVGRLHFEHWDNAIESAKVAAANMTDGDEAYRHVPYFFSDQFDLALNMLGYPSPDAQVVIRGDQANDSFTALYAEQGVLRAALMINDDAQMDVLRELIQAGAHVPDDLPQLADPSFDLASLK
jgi:NADPH-dependent 2,4-dienoyl-CoA reductase/sulfur reductase-like enzyme